MELRIASLLTIASVLSLSWMPGCASSSCTAAACLDQLTFRFDETVPRDYVVTVTVGTVVGTADCTAAASPDTGAAFETTLTGDLQGPVTCGTDAFVMEAAPEQVSIVIAYDDGTHTDANAQPAYEEQFPNGPDCGVGCRTSSIDIDVHAPDGA